MAVIVLSLHLGSVSSVISFLLALGLLLFFFDAKAVALLRQQFFLKPPFGLRCSLFCGGSSLILGISPLQHFDLFPQPYVPLRVIAPHILRTVMLARPRLVTSRVLLPRAFGTREVGHAGSRIGLS